MRIRRTIALGVTALLSTSLAAPAQARPATERPAAPAAPKHDTLFPSVGSTAYDVRSYDVKLRYEPSSNRLRATTVITARSPKPLTRVRLDLEGLTVTAVRADGRTAAFHRRGDHLVVTPKHRLGRSFRLAVDYRGVPQEHVDSDGSTEGWVRTSDGAIGLGEPLGTANWVPSNNTPGDKALWTFRVDVPSSVKVAANGQLTSRAEHGDRTTWTWKGTEPMASYLATVAVGKFEMYRSTITSVDDRKIPVWSFGDPTSSSTATARAQLPEVFAFEEDLFGPYPFASTGMIVDDAAVGYALETQTRPFYPGSVTALVHEMAHQWYGDSVSVTDWHDLWLAEGFATYAEWLYDAAHGGMSTQVQFQLNYARLPNDSLWHPAPTQFTKPAQLFDSPVYTRGAMTLEVLRERVGDPDFFAILKGWSKARLHGNATSADFEKYAEKVSGEDLTTLFHDWLVKDGKPSGY